MKHTKRLPSIFKLDCPSFKNSTSGLAIDKESRTEQWPILCRLKNQCAGRECAIFLRCDCKVNAARHVVLVFCSIRDVALVTLTLDTPIPLVRCRGAILDDSPPMRGFSCEILSPDSLFVRSILRRSRLGIAFSFA